MNIEQTIIDEVIRKSDIVEIIGKQLKLKRSGANYFACCPFHNEKSASFSVNSNKQFFHCFGCGESGNVITFVMKYHGWDFIQAVRSLALSSGIHIPENTNPISKKELALKKEHKATLNTTINKVVQFYRNNLINSNLAIHYLTNRGLSSAMIEQFEIGFAPNISNPLSNLFKDYSSNQFLIDCGLVIKNDSGKLFDRFRDRIMFPIKNSRGEVIGFGGRIIAHGEPKYLNSPESELFNKSEELYGLFEASRQIREQNHVIVVEGYMDVIAMVQFGVTNTVATMGTAATTEHIKKLFRLCDDIYYCFDGDNAGRKAAWRALERSISLVTDIKAVHFIFLPQEDDPDSFLRKHGTDKFKHYIENNSLSMSAFLLKQLSNEVNITSNEGRAKLISLAKPYIEQTQALALQVMLKKQLAQLVELEPNVLESILNNRSRYAFYTSKWNNKSISMTPQRMPILNKINLIINCAIKNVSWVINYKLPEHIDSYRQEIQELIIFLDYINNNYDNEPVDLNEIQQNLQLPNLNLDKIYTMLEVLPLTEVEFIQQLDYLLGFIKHKVNKNPKIPMKGI